MRACPDPNLTVQGLKERVLIGSVQACHKSVGSDGILQLITQTMNTENQACECYTLCPQGTFHIPFVMIIRLAS